MVELLEVDITNSEDNMIMETYSVLAISTKDAIETALEHFEKEIIDEATEDGLDKEVVNDLLENCRITRVARKIWNILE